MYPLLAVFVTVAGTCLLAFADRMTKNGAVTIGMRVLGVALILVGLSSLYLLLSGKVVLPLSNG